MSDHPESRRAFIKGSVAKGLIATNAAALAGLINTPGSAGADTTQPGTTASANTLTETKTHPSTGGNSNTGLHSSAQAALAAAWGLVGGSITRGTTTLPTQAKNPIVYSGQSDTVTEGGQTFYIVWVTPGYVITRQVAEVIP